MFCRSKTQTIKLFVVQRKALAPNHRPWKILSKHFCMWILFPVNITVTIFHKPFDYLLYWSCCHPIRGSRTKSNATRNVLNLLHSAQKPTWQASFWKPHGQCSKLAAKSAQTLAFERTLCRWKMSKKLLRGKSILIIDQTAQSGPMPDLTTGLKLMIEWTLVPGVAWHWKSIAKCLA